MDAQNLNLLNFLQAPHQLLVPIYQRNYSWTNKHCKQLWDDIFKIARKEEIYHFIGSIVFISPGEYQPSIIKKSLLIDGQQRICTITLLLHALGKVIEEKGIDFEVSREQINNLYIFNAQMIDELKYKIIMNKKDKHLLMDILNDREILNVQDKSSLLYRNYEFFQEKINNSVSNLDDLFLGVRKLMIVSISLTRDHDQPQLIFESLNSTGQALTETDLIRNYILIDLKHQEQEKIYDNYWLPMEKMFISDINQFDRFIRDYLTFKTNLIPKIEEIYEKFKEYTESYIKKFNNGIRNYDIISKIIEDIYNFSKYYSNMAFLTEPDKDLQEHFDNIKNLKVKVAYPFLLKVYNDYDNGIINKEIFIEILKLIESYVFRRSACEVPTNSLNKTFVLLIKAIAKDNYLESIKATLVLYKKYRIFPTDNEFKKYLKVKDVYSFRNNRYLLDKLELYGHKEKTVVEECTIEHIMPQNDDLSINWRKELGENWKEIHEKFRHTLGNLTLTGYNSELGDRPFIEKRDMKGGYKDSAIHLSQDIRDLDHWNEEEIIKRTKKLSKLALEVWPYPKIPDELLEKYKNQQTEVEDSNYINIIKNELENLLKDKWEIYSTKRKCIIFKASWLEDFKEFYSKNFPFLHYTVNSWMDNDGFEINVGFNLRESSNIGARVGLREKFTVILDGILQQEDTDFHYLISNKNTKFKEILIEDDDYTDDDLKNVAEIMVELITDTFEPIQTSIDAFKDKFKVELEKWKNQLVSESQ